MFSPEGQRTLDRRETAQPIGKWQFIKGNELVNLIGHVNSDSQRGFLIAGLRYFGSCTLVVSLRRRK